MQSRKIKVRKGPRSEEQIVAHGESGRRDLRDRALPSGGRRHRAVRDHVRRGGGGQAPAPPIAGRPPPSSEPAPGGTDEADLLGIGRRPGFRRGAGSRHAMGPGTPTDPPRRQILPRRPTLVRSSGSGRLEAPAPAARSAAPDVPAAAAPTGTRPPVTLRRTTNATDVTRSKATDDAPVVASRTRASKSHGTPMRTPSRQAEPASPATETPVVPDAPVAPSRRRPRRRPPSSLLRRWAR